MKALSVDLERSSLARIDLEIARQLRKSKASNGDKFARLSLPLSSNWKVWTTVKSDFHFAFSSESILMIFFLNLRQSRDGQRNVYSQSRAIHEYVKRKNLILIQRGSKCFN